ncbi:MAG TPA: sugar ABC transporter permease [Candidatus Pelethocola excrementipullorum]|nr:sugar ABC transporter permease [Candidatus Pelethocola excrementipullorum]
MKNSNGKRNVYGLLFAFIPIMFLVTFCFIPMFRSFILSFNAGKGVNLEWGGFTNYKRLFSDPVLIKAIKNTFTYLIIQVPIMTVLALVFAAMLNDKELKGKAIYRTCLFLPCVTSLVAASVLFKSLFGNRGFINTLLSSFNLIDSPIPWLIDPFWAKFVIIVVMLWRWTGYDMIFYLAGMQNIDSSIYEAAKLDGASLFQQFFRITIPILKPIILLTTIMSTSGTLQLFDEVATLTAGGPNNATLTISQYIYNLSFKFAPNFPYAATVSYVILILVAILTFIQFRVTREKN